ncbi:DUF3427 domain-containing protein [Guptibacillus hwajinpoensis]|uniref:Restriction endonuclease subunit R n=1 Tax=Guptibacillus hwajinpoensis TaxID=208199 RepID=A0A0J6CSE6_9BACL|nr:DUF3427 domain-containing protein [Alkalihalobacillus macyae]KMM39221.1 restriction endonuclease subunit R [Alkalihalobacillus macyae]
MTEKPGTYEELKQTNKHYPTNQKQSILLPTEYREALIHKSAFAIGQKYKGLLEEGNVDEAIAFTHKVLQLVGQENKNLFLPLSNVLYRYDDQEIPELENQHLSSIELISNEKLKMKNLFKSLKFEMLSADSVSFMVSFIRMSGLQLLIRPLTELHQRGIKVRILTSFYMNVTEAKALQKLLEFSNVEVRIFDSGRESFHTKGYLFERASGLHTGIIGSSNLSHAALINGHEWNVKVPDSSYLPIYKQAMEKFQKAWNDEQSHVLTEELLNRYQRHLNGKETKPVIRPSFQISQVAESKVSYSRHPDIEPNDMQKKALQALKHMRENGNCKGVVIAATGTGKTYLSAFDVFKVKPKRMLFLAHREELLDNAKGTFEKVFNNSHLCGKLTGKEKDIHQPFLFSTVQSLHSDQALHQFHSNEFDYIIVDEFHHAEAPSYTKILNYFEPTFLLGLTATPERMDGRDVLALCDYNVVYEIRLRDALETELIAPFHYFGLADDTVDYNEIGLRNGLLNERQLVKALKTNERVDYVHQMINRYGFDGEQLIGLGFCATIEHATFMSESFNRLGYVTTVLTGNDSPEYRRQVIQQLEDNEDSLQMIFSVNIFNEGIDIPRLNLILFLRPTESSTVFIQQLGRGLRKVEGKEFVTILDFIGNYQKSFIVPLALAGETNSRAFDKDTLRIAVQHEFADLPGASYVDLDQVSQKRILEKIDSIRMDLLAMLTSLYAQFKRELGRSPEVIDFLYSESAPNLHFFVNRLGSWVKTKKKMKDLSIVDEVILENEQVNELFERMENMYPLKWPYEFAILEAATEVSVVQLSHVLQVIQRRFGIPPDDVKHGSLIHDAMVKLTKGYKKHKHVIGTIEENGFMIDRSLHEALSSENIRERFMERIEYGIVEFRRTFKADRFLGEGERVIRYQNYSRNDLIFLFQAGVQEGTWREGVSRARNHYLLFINLNKDAAVSDHLHYKDYFIDQRHFHWQSQNQTSHNSSVGQAYVHHKENNIHIHLFVRKFDSMHGMTLPFTYLGEVDYVSSHGDKPMNIKWKIHHPVPEDLFIDLIR